MMEERMVCTKQMENRTKQLRCGLSVSSFGGLFLCLWWTMLCVSSILVFDNNCLDVWTRPKWLYSGLVFALGWGVISLKWLTGKVVLLQRNLIGDLGFCTLFVCALEAIVIILQTVFDLTLFVGAGCGSFDNAAGASSCLVFGMAAPTGKSNNRWCKMVFLLRLLCLVGIFLAQSRLAVVCALLVIAKSYFKLRMRWIIGVLIYLLLVATFFVKTDSTKGRVFIYSRTMEMIKERPIYGWGCDGFQTYYMSRQADYFKQHPNSKYARLADDVRHPLSDVLLVSVDYGIPLLLVIVCGVVALAYVGHRKNTEEVEHIVTILFCLALFCMFSYPMHYPFSWLMLFLAGACIVPYHFFSQRWLGFPLLALAVAMVLYLYNQLTLEHRWYRVAIRSERSVSPKVLRDYDTLHSMLEENPFFLYNEAAVHYEAGDYQEALTLANACEGKLSDYEVEMLKGDILAELHRPEEALSAYREAGRMIPSRILPLYAQWLVFCRADRKHQADSVGAVILRCKPKVDNEFIKRIKYEVRNAKQNTEPKRFISN